MEKEKKELHKKIAVHLLLCVIGILFLIFLCPKIIHFFGPLLIAWIIAMMANPMVRFLEKRIRIMRKHGSVIVIVFVLGAVAGLIYLIIWWVINQISAMIVDLPVIYESVVENLQIALASLHERFHIIPGNLQALISSSDNKLNDYIMTALNSLQSSPVTTVGNVASSVIDVFIISILTIMLSYFFIADREKINHFVGEHTPKAVRAAVKKIQETVLKALGGYLKACFQIMFVMFLILVIFFLILGNKHAIILAMLTALLDFLPFVGTGTILMPWAVYSLITGSYAEAGILVIAYFVTLLVHRLLEPKLVGDSIGMSPFLTLLSMFIGYRLVGMLGLILAIPLAMVLQVFFEEGVFERTIRGIKILANDLNEYRKF